MVSAEVSYIVSVLNIHTKEIELTMTSLQRTPESFVWVAIDVAKDRHEALIDAPCWRTRKRIRIQNRAEDFRAFAEFLHSLGLPVRIGFEPTSNYHRAPAYF